MAAVSVAALGWFLGVALEKLHNRDPDTLEATITRFNQFAEKGEDPDWADPEQIKLIQKMAEDEPVGLKEFAATEKPATTSVTCVV